MDPEIRQGANLVAEFLRHARLWPDRIALVEDDSSWSYSELNELVHERAAGLLRMGVRTGTYAGVHIRPSVELVACVLAILRTGAAYVPVDWNAPRERLEFVIEDADLNYVITDNEDMRGTPFVHPGELRAAGSSTSESLPALASFGGAQDAYVIYTSGSTGQPKGVQCSHHNVLRLFQVTTPQFRFTHEDVWSLFHSIAFDFSVWELFGALLFGGKLVIVPPRVARDTPAFSRLLIQRGVTVLNQTPSAFYNLLNVIEADEPDPFEALRVVVLGGERVQCGKLARWFNHRPARRCRLINMYGITETTVHVTFRELRADDIQRYPDSSPIGLPIADLEIHLMDSQLRAVPDGEVGEICVAGAGLARGYLNRAELTAQRFVAHPSGSAHNTRLYRSGDLGQRLPSGEYAYVGRADRQVKLRGYRIELGEIESLLAGQPGVAASHVAAVDQGTGEARLVAYVIPNPTTHAVQYRDARWHSSGPRPFLVMGHGLEVAYADRYEAVSAYRWLFEDRLYQPFGLRLREGARAIDVGAGIGLFGLYLMTLHATVKLEALEPEASRAEALRINLSRYGADHSVHCGDLSSLSRLSREGQWGPISLLHIDLRRPDVGRLEDITEDIWAASEQVVIELPERESRLEHAAKILDELDFLRKSADIPLGNGELVRVLIGDRISPGSTSDHARRTDSPGRLISVSDRWLHQLQDVIAAKLPHYMVPAQWHCLPRLPLTINGKVDERSLASLVTSSERLSRKPTDAIERGIQAIWLDVLKKSDIDLDIGLGEAGAQSLTVVMIAARLRKTFRVEIPVDELTDRTSIASLARSVRNRLDGSDSSLRQ